MCNNFIIHLVLVFSLFQIPGLTGCASVPGKNDLVEVIINEYGNIPFMLHFPSDSRLETGGNIDGLEKPVIHSKNDLWKLARYYHTERKKNIKNAYKWYNLIIEQEKVDSMAGNNLACLYFQTGRYAESVKLFKKIIAGEKPVLPAYYNLYLIYSYLGRTKDSVAVLLLMKERFPQDLFAPVKLGDIFLELEKNDLALEYYGYALATGVKNPEPLYKMARLKEKLKLYKEAEKYYRECIRKYSRFRYAYLDYANMLMVLNRKEDAKKVLLKSIKRLENMDWDDK